MQPSQKTAEEKLSAERFEIKNGFAARLWRSVRMLAKKPDIKPGELLKKYGAAYLLTSISCSLVSYGLCYFLINAGVNVPALLMKIGIATSAKNTNVGKAGLAYVVHKAASPIRFPVTVALTPSIAKFVAKEPYNSFSNNG